MMILYKPVQVSNATPCDNGPVFVEKFIFGKNVTGFPNDLAMRNNVQACCSCAVSGAYSGSRRTIGCLEYARMNQAKLEAEGSVLLHALLGTAPEARLARLYAQAVARSVHPFPLQLPALVRRFPRLLRIVEPLGGSEALIASRLRLAMFIVESTPAGARRMFPHGERSILGVVLRLSALMVAEGFLILPRLAARRWWTRQGRNGESSL